MLPSLVFPHVVLVGLVEVFNRWNQNFLLLGLLNRFFFPNLLHHHLCVVFEQIDTLGSYLI